MRKLIQGIVDFRKSLTNEKRKLFAQLALGQRPDSLFLACSDSRVVPNLFASTNPGDLFVVRNVGNLIPAYRAASSDVSVHAAIEFSLLSLEVKDLVICGHSECGAMEKLLEGTKSSALLLNKWLENGKASLERYRKLPPSSLLSPVNCLSQCNVLQQKEHVLLHPLVKKRVEEKKLRIHCWWFDIANADVYCYEEPLQKFVLMDEEEASIVLSRLS